MGKTRKKALVFVGATMLLLSIFCFSTAWADDAEIGCCDVSLTGGQPLAEEPPFHLPADNIVTIDRSRNISAIVAMSKALPHSGFNSTKVTAYATTPLFTAPYASGSLAAADIADALNALKMARYVAGLPYENVAFTPTLNDIAQHGAVLLAASNQFDHSPARPADMPQDFYSKGYRGCQEANIYAGLSNISNAVLGFISDGGAGNLEHVGHRRWVLKPGGQNFGIGYARNTAPGISYQGNRINMHVTEGLLFNACEADTFIAWPNAGDFPLQYFYASNAISSTPAYPWSVNLGVAYASPSKAAVTLRLTRLRDNKIWVFDSSTPSPNGVTDNQGMYFAVDNVGYGMLKALIFRPDTASLGPLREGDVFNIRITGIKTSAGADTVLEYTVNFFDIQKELLRSQITIQVKQGAVPIQGASVQIADQLLITDENGLVSLRVNNHNTYSYIVSREGFISNEGTVFVADADLSFEVSLAARDITVSGAVLYQRSPRPAAVTLKDSAGETVAETTTGPEGAYTLTVLPSAAGAPYTLVITKLGYLSYTLSKLTLTNGQQLPPIDISQLAGDVNGDGIVNSIDLTYLLSEFNRAPLLYTAADIDGDGIVNSVDLTYLLAGFNKRAVRE